MRLTVVGCSGSYPGPDSAASCYLLEADDERPHLADPARPRQSAPSARCSGTPTRSPIDAVFLSHLHADHCLDLCGYYVMRKYHPDGAQPRIPVWGPAGHRRADGAGLRPAGRPGHDRGVRLPRARRTRSSRRPVPRRRRCRSCTRCRPFGFRVTAGGRTLAYSGDTGPCAGLDELAAGADLLLAEASFRSGDDNPPDLHLTGADCGRAAAHRGVGRLVLTHVPPWYDPAMAVAEAKEQFSGR